MSLQPADCNSRQLREREREREFKNGLAAQLVVCGFWHILVGLAGQDGPIIGADWILAQSKQSLRDGSVAQMAGARWELMASGDFELMSLDRLLDVVLVVLLQLVGSTGVSQPCSRDETSRTNERASDQSSSANLNDDD